MKSVSWSSGPLWFSVSVVFSLSSLSCWYSIVGSCLWPIHLLAINSPAAHHPLPSVDLPGSLPVFLEPWWQVCMWVSISVEWVTGFVKWRVGIIFLPWIPWSPILHHCIWHLVSTSVNKLSFIVSIQSPAFESCQPPWQNDPANYGLSRLWPCASYSHHPRSLTGMTWANALASIANSPPSNKLWVSHPSGKPCTITN